MKLTAFITTVYIWLITLGVAMAGQQAPELIPFDCKFSKYAPIPFLQKYNLVLRDVLLGEGKRSSCQVLVVPSFDREWAVYLDSVNGNFEVVYSVMRKSLWVEMHRAAGATKNNLAALDNVPKDIDTFRAPLTGPVAYLLDRVWSEMLSRARKPTDKGGGLDGVSYYFSNWHDGSGERHGTTWSPERGTHTEELVAICEMLRNHARFVPKALVHSEVDLKQRAEDLLYWLSKDAPKNKP